MARSLEIFNACLLGGAVGDALGAPIEFLHLETIRDRYGPEGITDLDEAHGRLGVITDNTQMTLFTAEGLICAAEQAEHGEMAHIRSVVNRAYSRRLRTQYEDLGIGGRDASTSEGWLLGLEAL